MAGSRDSTGHGCGRGPDLRSTGRLRRSCGPPPGAGRLRLHDGGHRPVGVFAVFHGQPVVPGAPADPGARPWPLELRDAVRHPGHPIGQLYPPDARRRGPGRLRRAVLQGAGAGRRRRRPGAVPAPGRTRAGGTRRGPSTSVRARSPASNAPTGAAPMAASSTSTPSWPQAWWRRATDKSCRCRPNSSSPKTARRSRTASGMPPSAGSSRTVQPWRATGRSISATTSSPASRSLPAIRQSGGSFILTCKPSSHPTIAEYVSGAELAEHRETVVQRGKRVTYIHRWLAGVPLRGTKDALDVNCSPSRSATPAERKPTRTASSPICPSPAETVAELAACGRARWKIENETFNVPQDRWIQPRAQFRPRQEDPRQCPRDTQPARIRLPHRRGTLRHGLAQRQDDLGRSIPLLRTAPQHHSLHRLPRLDRPPRNHRQPKGQTPITG